MKLGKEEVKKIILSCMLLIALLYGYFVFLLGPLQADAAKSRAGIQALEPQIADAHKQISKTADLEKRAPAATAALEDLKKTIPDGAPIAWFPPKMSEFFKRHNIDKCSTRLVSESTDKVVPGFRRLIWAVEIPRTEFIPLGQAIASLENEEPLLDIQNVSVEANRDDAQFQKAVLVVSTLVKS